MEYILIFTVFALAVVAVVSINKDSAKDAIAALRDVAQMPNQGKDETD